MTRTVTTTYRYKRSSRVSIALGKG
jgi:hypothetical protein